MLAACLIALAAFALLLITERALLRYARKRFSLVIHVNGTRGKSTVTRMIHALFVRQGMAAYGKTTGSAARFLLPDGREKPVLRLGPANVREQRNMMIYSAFFGKERNKVLVFECNAIDAELQHLSMKWLRPDITVITNAREDHVQELGNAAQIAEAFANAIPDNSVLVTSDIKYAGLWEAAAKQKNLTLKIVHPDEMEQMPLCSGFPENTACVLGVADHLGINRNMALTAVTDHNPDAGAFKIYSWKHLTQNIIFADARAANDIESTNRLISHTFGVLKPVKNFQRVLLLVNREDRPDRTRDFLQFVINRENFFEFYFCLGHAPLLFRKKIKNEKIKCFFIKDMDEFEMHMKKIPAEEILIFGVGNFGGKGILVNKWLADKEKKVI